MPVDEWFDPKEDLEVICDIDEYDEWITPQDEEIDVVPFLVGSERNRNLKTSMMTLLIILERYLYIIGMKIGFNCSSFDLFHAGHGSDGKSGVIT